MLLTFNSIHDKHKLTFGDQEYIQDENNPYVFVSINPITSISNGGLLWCQSLTWCQFLTEIIIPNSVTSISNGTFAGCYYLSHIVLPNSITIINERAFQCCTSLTKMVMPNSVTYIGDYAFHWCKSLTTIETNDEHAYIIEYCKIHYPHIEVLVTNLPYVLK